MKVQSIYVLVLIIVLFTMVPVVTATLGNDNDTKMTMQALPELDMTGMHTDIELIEIDSEIINATDDWIILAHDDAGKKVLIDEIDNSTLTVAEKIDSKKALKKLWDTYPTKFEDTGKKSVEISIQSDGSNRTVSIPIGHVTRISFDREKIKQNAKDQNNSRLMKLANAKGIVLNEIENETIRNITQFREKRYATNKNTAPSSVQFGGSSGNSGLGTSSSPDFSSLSYFSRDCSIPSSSGFEIDNSGKGLMAWSGGSTGDSLPDYDPYYGHNSFAYWATKKWLRLPDYVLDTAATSGSAPDQWTPSIVDPLNRVVHCITHYWNPDFGYNIIGQAPVTTDVRAGYASDALNELKSCGNGCTASQYLTAAEKFGYVTHFLTDVGNPMHTGREYDQINDDNTLGTPNTPHTRYEDYVANNWKKGKLFENYVKNENNFYHISSPSQATKNLATFSHAYLDTLYYRVKNNPSFDSDMTVYMLTENCILASARYTNGLAYYLKSGATPNHAAADFKYEVLGDEANLQIKYTDTSNLISPITSRSWGFSYGTPSSSTDSPVTVTYSSRGMKLVILNVMDTKGYSDVKYMNVPVGVEPHAQFSYTPNGRLTIQFYDISTVNSECYPITRNWTFGDEGSPFSTEQNPIHTYSGSSLNPGILRITTICGNSEYSMPVIVVDPIYVEYLTEITGKTVNFTDTSSVTAESYKWSFGDNSTISTEQNPTHTYGSSGTYTVRLTAKDPYYHDEYVKEKQIVIPDLPPLANFTATPIRGYAPLTVQFTDTSTGKPTKWSWDFGDGNPTNKSKRNPLHTYSNPGPYTVSLNVTNISTGGNTTTKADYIFVTTPPPPIAYFTVNVTSGIVPLPVAFNGSSVRGPANSWRWNFGDGNTSTNQNPVHIYNSKGNYTVSLNVTNYAGTNTKILPDWIRAGFNIVTVEDAQTNPTISFTQNTIIRLILVDKPSTGYEWFLNLTPGLDEISNIGIPAPGNQDGASGLGVWDITAADAGEQNISGIFRRSWEPESGDEENFILKIIVKPSDRIGIFRNGTWYVDYDGNGAWNSAIDKEYTFGIAGDYPVSGDWNLDGRSEIGVFNSSTHRFDLDYNGNGVLNGPPYDRRFIFNTSGDIPLSGDWNMDGRSEIGVFSPSTQVFSLDYNGNRVWNGPTVDRQYNLGIITGDIPLSGDWNLDGKSEIGVFNSTTHRFYLDYNGNGLWDGSATDKNYYYNIAAGDAAVSGDWNLDGRSEIGVLNSTTHRFYLDYNGNGIWNGSPIDKQYYYNVTGGQPVSGRWNIIP